MCRHTPLGPTSKPAIEPRMCVFNVDQVGAKKTQQPCNCPHVSLTSPLVAKHVNFTSQIRSPLSQRMSISRSESVGRVFEKNARLSRCVFVYGDCEISAYARWLRFVWRQAMQRSERNSICRRCCAIHWSVFTQQTNLFHGRVRQFKCHVLVNSIVTYWLILSWRISHFYCDGLTDEARSFETCPRR